MFASQRTILWFNTEKSTTHFLPRLQFSLMHFTGMEILQLHLLQINHSAIHLKFRHKVTSFYHNNQRINQKSACSHLLRLAEILDDERHLAGGEELGVFAEGAFYFVSVKCGRCGGCGRSFFKSHVCMEI